jgi:hypothetical protein
MTGTLTSITDFASSVSRNMDRLSLDNDYVRRNESLRRNKPCRLSEGLKNGLSGLGLSVLGEVLFGSVSRLSRACWSVDSAEAYPFGRSDWFGVDSSFVLVVT